MSDPKIKFSGLTPASPLDGTETIAIVQGGNSRKTTIDTGSQFKSDQNTRTSDAVTFATINTGQGANELYPMNQAVRTTDVVQYAGISFDGGTNVLGDYVEAGTTFSTAFGAVTVTIGTDNSRYERIGNQVFAEFDFSFSALDTTDTSSITLGLPEFLANANFVQGNIDTRYSTGLDLSTAGEVYFTSNNTVGGIGLVNANGSPLRYNTGELQTSGDIKIRVQYTTS